MVEIDNEKYIKQSDIQNLILELSEEYDKIQIKFDEVFYKKDKKDFNDFILQHSYSDTLQELSWMIGKLNNLVTGGNE